MFTFDKYLIHKFSLFITLKLICPIAMFQMEDTTMVDIKEKMDTYCKVPSPNIFCQQYSNNPDKPLIAPQKYNKGDFNYSKNIAPMLPNKKYAYVSPYTNVLQNGSDPILTVILSQNSNHAQNCVVRKSPAALLDTDNNFFEELPNDSWVEENFLNESDLLGEFDTPI